MKILQGLGSLVPLVFLLHASGSFAQDSWWDKVREIVTPESGTESSSAPSLGELGDAFKEALQVASEIVVERLGSVDGFNADAAVHIPLPEELKTVKSVLDKAGMSAMVDELELKMNRAAEDATPRAKALFLEAIDEMTFDDVQRIYKGEDDSATRYFQQKMSQPLHAEMQPIVEASLSEVGAIQAYDRVMGTYQSLPFVPDVKADLTDYVVEKGMEGIFYYLAREEAAIRNDPVKQTTDLLKKVFGAVDH